MIQVLNFNIRYLTSYLTYLSFKVPNMMLFFAKHPPAHTDASPCDKLKCQDIAERIPREYQDNGILFAINHLT